MSDICSHEGEEPEEEGKHEIDESRLPFYETEQPELVIRGDFALSLGTGHQGDRAELTFLRVAKGNYPAFMVILSSVGSSL